MTFRAERGPRKALIEQKIEISVPIYILRSGLAVLKSDFVFEP